MGLSGLVWNGVAILVLAHSAAMAGCTLRPPRERGTTAVKASAGTHGKAQQTDGESGLACPTGWGRVRSADITTTSSFAANQHRSCDRLDLMNCGPMCARMPEVCVLGKPECRPE